LAHQAFYESTCDAFTSAIAESDVGPKACILCINNGIAAALLPRDSASASSSAVPAADFALSFTKPRVWNLKGLLTRKFLKLPKIEVHVIGLNMKLNAIHITRR
jgi:hypothetical protein